MPGQEQTLKSLEVSRKHGKKGSACQRLRKPWRKSRVTLPSMILTTTSPSFFIDERGAANLFRHTKIKSPGPHNISGQLLKTCADQSSGIFPSYFFTFSRVTDSI